MSPAKTLYVRDDDVEVWEYAELLAKATNRSLSTFVTEMLRTQGILRRDDEANTVKIDVGDPTHTVGFKGRWLVPPDSDETRTKEDGHDAGAYWGVALTKRGRIAVYTAHCNDGWPAMLADYDDLDAASADNVPADIIAMAAKELGQQHVVWRDI